MEAEYINCRCVQSYFTKDKQSSVKTGRDDFLHSIRILFESDLRNGFVSHTAIKNFLDDEDYEALKVIKDVFDEHGECMPI